MSHRGDLPYILQGEKKRRRKKERKKEKKRKERKNDNAPLNRVYSSLCVSI
jgi:hypothetical protein